MRVKRSRVARSSSFDDTGLLGVLNQSSTSQSLGLQRDLRTAPKISRPSEWSPPGILTVSSPEIVKESCYGHGHGQGQGGNFLDNCYFCKKKMLQNDEVFMYGSMHGFCSPECRGKQIAIDSALERVAKQLRANRTECSTMNDVKDQKQAV